VIPTTEPTTATAGATWQWQVSDPVFPAADGWVLSYAIRGPDAPAWEAGWVATADGVHTITISAAATAAWTAGRYELTRIWTLGSVVHHRPVAPLAVAPNPATAAPGERVTHAARTLAVIEAALEGRVTDDIQNYMIGSRQVIKIPVMELLRLRQHYRLEVYRERHPGKTAPPLLVRFSGVGG
jgi:hypothetical protein